ncbi:MAG: hypothetical protein KAI18_01760, partial [Candidatus Aenigmarchaeota archaeon]|nr:hypothetical protein [Candidatus Aenigmarchaeota archaeon]
MDLFVDKKDKDVDTFDFTIHCSPIYSAALVSPENAWANFVQKINYANQFIEGFEDKGYSKVNLGSQIYDIETHRKLVESCKTHLEETYSDCLMDFKATDSSVDLSIIIEAMLPKSARTDLDNLLGYDRLMINAVNLKYREALLTKNSTSKSKDTNRITSFADTLKEIPDVISAAISNPKETLTKAAAPLAIAGSLLMSGFASAFDSNHDVAPDSADTAYQEMLHKLDSILSDLPDILPVAAAQPVTQNIPQQPTMFAGYAFLDGSIVNSSEVSLTALVNGTSYNITSWFTDGSGDDYCSITIPFDATNAGKNVTFFCLDEDTNQEFKSEEIGEMVSGGSYYPYNVSFIDDQSSIFYNQILSIFANESDDKLDDVTFSITTNENVSILVKEGESVLLNSTDLKKYWNFILNNQTEGEHDYTIIVSDKNNNSKTTQLSTSIDTTQPGLIDYIISIFDGDGDGNIDDVKLTLNLTEPASTYATVMGLVANATNSTFLTNPILYFNNLTKGNHSGLDVNTTDLAGNENNFSLFFPIDITKKVIEEDDPETPPVVPPSGGGGGGGGGG